MIVSNEDRDEFLNIAACLYSAFEHEDVRLGIAALAAALLMPDVDIPFMGDDNVVKITDLAIRGYMADV